MRKQGIEPLLNQKIIRNLVFLIFLKELRVRYLRNL